MDPAVGKLECSIPPRLYYILPRGLENFSAPERTGRSFCPGRLSGRPCLVGDSYTIADMSLWGQIDRASHVMKGEVDPLAEYPNLRKWLGMIDGRRAIG